MRSTYKKEDVEILLKDISGLVTPKNSNERERLIQNGRHYSEMLPLEYKVSNEYMQAYKQALEEYAQEMAGAVGVLCDKIINRRGKETVLVSLARAGIPIGILIKRYIKWKYNVDVPHYSISIIRGRGIDKNAMKYILKSHLPQEILFVDGWVGKGAIFNQVKEAVKDFQGVSSELAVVSDPANITELCGTHNDILIPSSCLNCTVSGLISRTFLREDIIGKDDFHGAIFYEDLIDEDLSYDFINAIEMYFSKNNIEKSSNLHSCGIEDVKKIAAEFEIKDINLIKPGIGETTRVLLRRVPWKVLVNEKYINDTTIKPILKLAEEKHVEVQYYPLKNYKACGIIKKMGDV